MSKITASERFFTRIFAHAVTDPWHCASSRASFMAFQKRYARFRGARLPRDELERQLSPIFEHGVKVGRLARLYRDAVDEGRPPQHIETLNRALRPSEEGLFEAAKAYIDGLPGRRIARARVLHDMADGLDGTGLWIRDPRESGGIKEQLLVENMNYKSLKSWARRAPYS